MTDFEWKKEGPQFERDRALLGSRTAVERVIRRLARARTESLRIRPFVDAADALVDAVARRRGIGYKLIRSRSLVKPVVNARHEAWFRLWVGGQTGPKIAEMFGVDPSTIADGRQAFRKKFPALAAEIEATREPEAAPATVIPLQAGARAA